MKKKFLLLSVLAGFSAMSLVSCSDEEATPAPAPAVSGVSVEGDVVVYLTSTDKTAVTPEGVTVSVDADGIAHISGSPSVKSRTASENAVYLPISKVNKVDAIKGMVRLDSTATQLPAFPSNIYLGNDAGSINFYGVEFETVTIELGGKNSIVVAGKANHGIYKVKGGGNAEFSIDASQLIVSTATVELKGNPSIKVAAGDLVEGEVSGNGTLYIKDASDCVKPEDKVLDITATVQGSSEIITDEDGDSHDDVLVDCNYNIVILD